MGGGKRRDLLWGILSQFLQYGSALLVLPIMVTRLSSPEVGLWFVFMAIQSLVTILDFGFAPTFSRNFAFVFAGVQELQKEGVAQGTGNINADLLASVIRSSRLLYAGIATLVGLALAGPGTWYLVTLLKKNPGISGVWPAWWVFALAVTINIYFLWYTPLLLGSGQVRKEYKVGIINRGCFALFAILSLVWSGRLVWVSAAYLLGVLISRIYSGRAARDLVAAGSKRRIRLKDALKVMRIIWHTSYRSGVVSIGAFLITRFGVFVVSSFYGLTISARYSITLQIFSVILSISQVALITFLPRLASLRVSGDMAEFRRLFLGATLYTWIVFGAMSIGVILFGNTMLAFIHSKTLLLNRGLLGLLAFIWLLEANHAASGAVIATGNTIPFMKAAVWSGLAICGLSLTAGWLRLGLGSIILSQGIVQAAYNNWKWPQVVYAELGIRWRDVFGVIG